VIAAYTSRDMACFPATAQTVAPSSLFVLATGLGHPRRDVAGGDPVEHVVTHQVNTKFA
jgi:hypothetical protein